MKLKVLTLLGTRPEIIRLSRIISNFDKVFNHILVNSRQNFDVNLNKVFFESLKIRKPNYNLRCKNNNSINFISNVIKEFDKILLREKPDCVLILGDTNTGLAVLAAKKRKVPIFHLEAGNRCYDMRVPEEINRKIIDHISDINLTYSEIAKKNLILERFPSNRVIKVGSPLYEVLEHYNSEIKKSNILQRLKLKQNKYFLLSSHRDENLENDKNLFIIKNTILNLTTKYKMPVIISTHPRLKKKLFKLKINKNKLVKFNPPFDYFDYIQLQKNSNLTISDSGSIIEESNILNFPAINFRETTERHEGLEKGSCIISGMNIKSINQSINLILKIKKKHKKNLHPDYEAKDLSFNIIKIIQSYTNYVNKRIWLK
jgi:UDP-N-acetylglucosamine 2-epimerase (non-hydrolysing)